MWPPIGALHESGSGTNRTNRAGLMMSVVRGRPETAFRSCLLPQHDGTAPILANDVERVLADIDADYGGRGVEFL
jgi:hypothetical protein